MTEHETVTVMAPAVADGPPSVRSEVALIPLRARDGSTRGFTIVDPEDVDRLTIVPWYLQKGGYAVRTVILDGQKKMIYMHRVILDAPEGLVVDHINGVRSDNRKANLRAVTHRQNIGNQLRSSITGVHRASRNQDKWVAYTNVGAPEGRKRAWLGTFNSQEAAKAAMARHLAAYDPDAFGDLLETT